MSSREDEKSRPGGRLVLGVAVVGICAAGVVAWSLFGGAPSDSEGTHPAEREKTVSNERGSPDGETASSDENEVGVEREATARGEESGSGGEAEAFVQREDTGTPEPQGTPAERAARVLDIPKQDNQPPSYLLDKSKTMVDDLTDLRRQLDREARRAEQQGDEEAARRRRIEAERVTERLETLEQSIGELRELVEEKQQSSLPPNGPPSEHTGEK